MKYYEDPEAKQHIDAILSQNATLQANLGSEHSKNSPERNYGTEICITT